jgi:hypothetical protein
MDSKLFTTTPAIDKIILTKKQITGRIATQTKMSWRIVKVSKINLILQAACQRSTCLVAQADTAQKDAQKTPHVAALSESWRSRKMIKTAVQRRRLGWNQKPVSGIYCLRAGAWKMGCKKAILIVQLSDLSPLPPSPVPVPVVYMARDDIIRMRQIYFKGHRKGWALKIETLLGPEMATSEASAIWAQKSTLDTPPAHKKNIGDQSVREVW